MFNVFTIILVKNALFDRNKGPFNIVYLTHIKKSLILVLVGVK